MGDPGHVHLRPRLTAIRYGFVAPAVVALLLGGTAAAGRPTYAYPPPLRLSDGSTLASPVTFTAAQANSSAGRDHGLAGVAILVNWSQLCPARDRCDFSLIDDVLRFWGDRGRRVVLGVATVGFPYKIVDGAGARFVSATPGWVLDAVTTYDTTSLTLGDIDGRHTTRERFPSYADPRFLDEVGRLVAKLARYDGNPAIAQLRISVGLLTEDNASPAGLDYVLPGFGDREWLAYCSRVTALFERTFRRTELEFDLARLAMAHEAGDAPLRDGIDRFLQSLAPHHVLLAFNGLRPSMTSAMSRANDTPPAADGWVGYAVAVLRRARRAGEEIGLELYAPTTMPDMTDLGAIRSIVAALRPSRIVVFSTETEGDARLLEDLAHE